MEEIKITSSSDSEIVGLEDQTITSTLKDVKSDPAFWCGCFDSIGLDPLHVSFIRLKFLCSNLNVMSAIESLIMIMVLIESNLECDYYDFFIGVMTPLSIISQIFYSWVSGVLADNTERVLPQVLGVFAIGACIVDPIFFYFSYYSPYLVTGVFLIRNCIMLQINIHAMKLFKMRLVKINMKEEYQVKAFLNLQIWTDIFSRFATVIALYGATYYLLEKGILSYESTKFYYFAFSMFWDISCVILSFSLKRDYYYLENESMFNTKESGGIRECWSYFINSSKKFVNTKLLFHVTTIIIVYSLLLSGVLLVLRFKVIETDVPIEVNKTKENYCGGEVINLIQNQTFQEFFRVIGTLIFIFAYIRMLASHFFKRVSHFVNSFQIMCILGIYFLPENKNTIGSLILAIIVMFMYIQYNYMYSVMNTIADADMIGYATAMQSSLMQLAGLIPAFTSPLLTKSSTSISLIIGFILIMLYHVYITNVYNKEVKSLDEKGGVDVDNCYKTIVLGYGWEKY